MTNHNVKRILLFVCLIGLLSSLAMALTVYSDTFGHNSTDATVALENAVDSGADTVIVPHMGLGNDWNISWPIGFAANQDLIFEEGVLVKAGEVFFWAARMIYYTVI